MVELRDEFGSDLADYAWDKVTVALTHTGRALLWGQVRIVRHPDPARERPIDVHATRVMAMRGRPLVDTAEAVQRLALTGLPFLFYVDADHGRANVLYHRADGDCGLIDPVVDD